MKFLCKLVHCLNKLVLPAVVRRHLPAGGAGQVVGLVSGVGQGPVLLVAPPVDAHDEQAHRCWRLGLGLVGLQPAVEMPQVLTGQVAGGSSSGRAEVAVGELCASNV